MGVLVEQIAASAIRTHLLANLPAKVAAVNALRAASLLATVAGPYTIASGGKLYVSLEGATAVTVSLTSGSRTAAQIATEVNATVGLSSVAAADALGRLSLTSQTNPTASTSSVGVTSGTDAANDVFGWDAGGESVARAPLVAPGYRGVADGWPVLNDLGGGFWVIIGDRESMPAAPGPRVDEYLVGLELAVFCPVTNVQVHRDREALHSCIRCVRELLLTDGGRQAGRASTGDIVLVTEKAARIPGRPWQFKGNDAPNVMFDVAAFNLNVRVFERPASS